MPYKINGFTFVIPPTTGRWIEPRVIDIDGNGRPVYPAFTEFQLKWQNLEPSGTYQLYEFFRTINITGTATVELPRYGFSNYTFWEYSGCVVYIPRFGEFFAQNTLDVELTISKVRYDSYS